MDKLPIALVWVPVMLLSCLVKKLLHIPVQQIWPKYFLVSVDNLVAVFVNEFGFYDSVAVHLGHSIRQFVGRLVVARSRHCL